MKEGFGAKGRFFISDEVRLIKKSTALFLSFYPPKHLFAHFQKKVFKELKTKRLGILKEREKTDNFFVKKLVVRGNVVKNTRINANEKRMDANSVGAHQDTPACC